MRSFVRNPYFALFLTLALIAVACAARTAVTQWGYSSWFRRGGTGKMEKFHQQRNKCLEEAGERFVEADIHRIRGELLRLDGENELAEACFETALEMASKQGALSLELRATTSLARQAMDAKRGPEARRLLAEV